MQWKFEVAQGGICSLSVKYDEVCKTNDGASCKALM